MKKCYKTFTKEQGFKVINQLFKGAKITKVFNSLYELSIIFTTKEGEELELYTSGDNYFQTKGNEYVIC